MCGIKKAAELTLYFDITTLLFNIRCVDTSQHDNTWQPICSTSERILLSLCLMIRFPILFSIFKSDMYSNLLFIIL